MNPADLQREPEFEGKLWLPDPVDVRRLIETDEFQTLSKFRVGLPDGRLILIEPGFVYDKGSVPRFAQWYLRRDEAQAERSFLTHDYLYVIQGVAGDWIDRKFADDLMYEIMKHDGLRMDKRLVAYRAVRLAGWRIFNERARANGNPFYD